MDSMQQLIERGTVWISPRLIVPHHEATDHAKLSTLMRSMHEHGWIGRPIVAHPCDAGRYQAWSASHRLAAALQAGLALVPVFVVDMARSANVSYRHFGFWFGDSAPTNPVAHLMMLDEEKS